MGIMAEFWNENEIQFLRNNWHLTNQEIAKSLNRSVSSVENRKFRFKYGYINIFEKKWTKEKIIKELQNISNTLGHSPSANEVRKINEVLVKTAQNCFGSFNNAKRLAGIPTYNVGNKFFLPSSEITEDFCYFFGVWLGDGCISHWRGIPNLVSVNTGLDLDFAEYLKPKIEKWLQKELFITSSMTQKGNVCYYLKINSREFCKFLSNLEKDLSWVYQLSREKKHRASGGKDGSSEGCS